MDAEQKRYLEQTSPKRRRMFERVFAGTATRQACIKAKCIDCVGHEDIVERVGGCDITTCPLWTFRPYQPKGASRKAPRRAGRPLQRVETGPEGSGAA